MLTTQINSVVETKSGAHTSFGEPLATNVAKERTNMPDQLSTPPTENFCEEMFEQLASSVPDRLVQLLQSSVMQASDLTFAAEIAGRMLDSARVRPALLQLLKHPDPVVREGAIYGIAYHMDSSVRSELQRMSSNDTSPGVRSVASDILAATS